MNVFAILRKSIPLFLSPKTSTRRAWRYMLFCILIILGAPVKVCIDIFIGLVMLCLAPIRLVIDVLRFSAIFLYGDSERDHREEDHRP